MTLNTCSASYTYINCLGNIVAWLCAFVLFSRWTSKKNLLLKSNTEGLKRRIHAEIFRKEL